jgi:hypothetical protein
LSLILIDLFSAEPYLLLILKQPIHCLCYFFSGLIVIFFENPQSAVLQVSNLPSLVSITRDDNDDGRLEVANKSVMELLL